MGDTALKPVPKKTVKAKVPTKKKAKVIVKTRYFGFIEHTDIKDLSKAPLKIKQLVAFIPQDKDENPVDEKEVVIDIHEMKAKKTGERADSLLVRIKGKVTKTEGYNFIVEEVEQDEAKLPLAKKPKNGKGAEMFVTAKLEVVGVDDKARGKSGLEFVLPPMEYDETLELKMKTDLPNPEPTEAKISFGSYGEMLKAKGVTPVDKKGILPKGGVHNGNMHHVVIHCMCGITKAEDPNDMFDVDLNIQILKAVPVSAHYLIDRGGALVEAVDIHRVAHHAGSSQNTTAHGLYYANSRSIGIELLGIPDSFRDAKVKAIEKLQKKFDDKKAKLEADKKKLEEGLANREAEKAAGKQKVKFGKGTIDVDVAIAAIKKAIAAQDAKIAALKRDPLIDKWETFTKDKDTDGVPINFKYTKEQYATLGAVMEVVGKRYGYAVVASHHFIIPAGKTDPGIYFDWGQLTPFLLPGTLSGDEAGDGGAYVVAI
jgi:hypothetical protein